VRPRIVVTHWVHPEIVALLAARGKVIANPTRDSWPRAELLEHAAQADALIAFMPDWVDEAFLAACPRLRIVACALKGYDNFDVAACTRRGVWLTVVPDLLTEPTAELAIGLMIGLARNFRAGDRWVRSGDFSGWRPMLYGATLSGATVGIVGMGAVGQAIARRLAGFGARLVYHDPVRLPPEREAALGLRRAGFETLLIAADVVVLAAPLTPATRHLIDAETLALMRPGALLVNVGRGSVVDEDAVAASLAASHLGGYAADVFAFEDWTLPGRPRGVPRALRDRPRTLFTGHMGSAVDSVRRDIARAAARAVIQALDGEIPDGAVNRVAQTANGAPPAPQSLPRTGT
jgi:phosphonate dehydrogenase